jgi:pantoate kinase
MSATAFAPGSVTTVFVPQGGTSALGISFATADGVTATVDPADETAVHLDGRPAEVAPVAGVLRRLDVSAHVHLDTDVPIGCGFGVSGAATLATAFAANAEGQLGRERTELVEASHQAEVAAGTGLGDVFIQNRGGVVWDVGEGLCHAERSARIEYVSFGEISTSEVLGDEGAMERVEAAGTKALAAMEPSGPLARLFDDAWTFATRVSLATSRVQDAVERVRAAGGAATMAMIGETVVATGTDGLLPNDTRIAAEGAQLR